MKIINEKVITKDNFELDVKISLPDGDYKKIVVMCHGLTSSKEGRREQLKNIAEKLCNDGYKVIQFDWRGHGESSGIDLDVNLTGFQTDLTTIIDAYVKDEEFYMFGFSFGGFAVNQWLYLTQNTSVKKVALIGPPLNPIYSSLLNKNEFCYQEIYDAIQDGSLEKNGYAYWASKDWKVSKTFLDQCREYDYRKAIAYLSNRTLLLQGKNDKNVDKNFNEMYANEYNFDYKEYDASHSLWEVIDEAAEEIIKFYNC